MPYQLRGTWHMSIETIKKNSRKELKATPSDIIGSVSKIRFTVGMLDLALKKYTIKKICIKI